MKGHIITGPRCSVSHIAPGYNGHYASDTWTTSCVNYHQVYRRAHAGLLSGLPEAIAALPDHPARVTRF